MARPDVAQCVKELRVEVKAELAAIREMLAASIGNVRAHDPDTGEAVIFRHDGKLPTLGTAEYILIREALKEARYANAAAKLLGIGKTTMYRKIKELGL